MLPFLNLPGKSIPTYMLMAVIGALVAGLLACRLTRKRNLNDNDTIIVMLFAAVGVFVGGAILYAITKIRYIPLLFSVADFWEFVSVLGYIFGGSVFYGGLIGGTVAALITIKIKKMPLPIIADILAVCIPLFHAFARVGCFLGGCCYGIECEFGFTAHGNTLVPELNDVSRFPVQLLEASLNLVLFAVLLMLYKKISGKGGFFDGKLIFVYLMSYAVIRFFDEFLRGDAIRGFIFGLSTSQFISVLIEIAAVSVLVFKFVKWKKESD